MKRRMTQGLSVVLSTAMVLSGSGIGTLSAAASVKEDHGMESNVNPAETAEKQEEQENKDETEKESLDETKKEENQDVTESSEKDEPENESDNAECEADAADEETIEGSSEDVTEAETEENIEGTEESTEKTEKNTEETNENDANNEENEKTDNDAISEEERQPEEIKSDDETADNTVENEEKKDEIVEETPAASEEETETADKDNTEDEKKEDVLGAEQTTEKETSETVSKEEVETTKDIIKNVQSSAALNARNVMLTTAEDGAKITEDELKTQLEDTTSSTISIDEDLVFALDATLTAAKTINIAKGKTLTVSGTINSSGKDLYFTGKGTVVVTSEKGLQGKIRIGNGTAGENITCHIADNSSIYLSGGGLFMRDGGILQMDSTAKVEGNDKAQQFNISANTTFDISNGAAIILKQSYIFNKSGTGVNGKFSDQGKTFTLDDAAENITVAAATDAPADNQLTAGDYVWDGTCFTKSSTDTSITADELKTQLEDTTTSTISIDEDLVFALDATLTAAKTINIAEGKTLTVSGTINSSGKDLYFTGKGTVVVTSEKGLQGKIRIGNGTTDENITCHIADNSSIYLSGGGLFMRDGGILQMDSTAKIEGNDKAQQFNISANATFDISNGATIILKQSYIFNKSGTGVNGKFSDQGKTFTLDGAADNITVAAATNVPADNQLTDGNYVWDGTCFYKEIPPEPEKVTLEDLKSFLLSKTDTSLTLTNDLTLTEEITADNTNDKDLIIPGGVTLTISAPLASTSKWLRFKGNGTLIINPSVGNDGKSADTLIGKIALGNDKAENPKVILKAGSSINATINLSSNNLSLTMEDGTEIKCSNTANMQFKETAIADGSKITLTEGKSFTTNKPALFSDQGHSFTLTTAAAIASAGTAPADDQLTAGTYIWNGTQFYKEALSGITTAADLKTALEKTEAETILVTKDITLSDTVVMGAKHTLCVADGVTLTITGCIDTKYKREDGNISAYQAILDGNGTIKLTGTGENLKGSFIVKNKQLTIEEGSSLLIEKGSLIIEKNASLTINSSLGIKAGRLQSIQIKEGGVLTGTDNAGIQFAAESFVQGASGKFSDQGKQLTTNERVNVLAADTAPADNQLTAGIYTWNGTCFAKTETSEEPSKPVPGNITNEEELIAALQSDVTNLLVTESFKLQTNVTLTSNHILEVAEGKTLTITGQLATGKARLTFVGKGKVLVRLKGNLNGRIYIGLENQKEPKGGYIVLSDEGKISSGNPFLANGGKLEINAPEGISLSKGNTFTIENGGILTGTGGIRLAEGAKVVGTAGKFSDQGSSFSVSDEVVVAAANTPPADNQLSAGTYTWNGTCFFKPVPAPLPSTELKDGILILSSESVNHGSDEGWAWDAEKNVLNVNYRFKDIKQIQFAKSDAASIKLNGDITLTPDEGMPAIIAGGNFLFRADEPYTLTVTGTIKAEGKIEFINQITLNQSGSSDEALLQTEGDIMVKGNAKVIVNNQGTGAAIAGNAVTVKEESELHVTGKGREAALKANGILGIGGPLAVVTAINRGKGPAINKDPNISDYPDVKISASTSASGRPGVNYNAADIQNYRYIKINKNVTLSGNSTAAEIEKAVENLTADDYDAIDTVIEHIHSLSDSEKSALQPETLQKLDSLLQKATGIRPKVDLSDTADTPYNQQILKAEIFGALIAAGLDTNASRDNTSLSFVVTQLKSAADAAATFECSLLVNGNEIGLRLPVTLKVELPPEYFPLGADQMFLRGIRRPVMQLRSPDTASEDSTVERWLDFVYDGKDNSATFQTDLLGTFSLIRKVSVNGPGISSGSGGGGGRSSSGVSRSTSSGTLSGGPGAGSWVLDSVGWWYQYADQSYPSNGWFALDYSGNKDWYYFNQNGYMLTGWVLSDGKWYYLNPVSDGTLGRMLTGWQQINGKWYYLNEQSDGTKGAMLTDTWIGDNYVNHEGIWEEGKKR